MSGDLDLKSDCRNLPTLNRRRPNKFTIVVGTTERIMDLFNFYFGNRGGVKGLGEPEPARYLFR
jgi:hypothetical protein